MPLKEHCTVLRIHVPIKPLNRHLQLDLWKTVLLNGKRTLLYHQCHHFVQDICSSHSGMLSIRVIGWGNLNNIGSDEIDSLESADLDCTSVWNVLVRIRQFPDTYDSPQFSCAPAVFTLALVLCHPYVSLAIHRSQVYLRAMGQHSVPHHRTPYRVS
jgi:hypothetical protein